MSEHFSEDFQRFKCKFSEDFPKLIRNLPINYRNFPKIAQGCGIFSSNLRKCFDHIETNFGSFNSKRAKLDSTYDVTDILTCEDVMFSQGEKYL